MHRVSQPDWNTPGECSGHPGLVQPAPHVPTADEVLHMIAKSDPDDPKCQ